MNSPKGGADLSHQHRLINGKYTGPQAFDIPVRGHWGHRILCRWWGSNPWPSDHEPKHFPTELSRPLTWFNVGVIIKRAAVMFLRGIKDFPCRRYVKLQFHLKSQLSSEIARLVKRQTTDPKVLGSSPATDWSSESKVIYQVTKCFVSVGKNPIWFPPSWYGNAHGWR